MKPKEGGHLMVTVFGLTDFSGVALGVSFRGQRQQQPPEPW